MEDLIKELSRQLGGAEGANNPSWGMFAPAPEVIDQVRESVMKAREEHPLRRLFEIRVHPRKQTGHGHDLLDAAKHCLRWTSRPWPFLHVRGSFSSADTQGC